MPSPTLYWMRRDFRLADNPALSAAASAGPVLALYILDPAEEALGAAPRFRLNRALAQFAARLEAQGGRLILRKGVALEVLQELIAETGATALHWNRLYDKQARARDEVVKATLKAQGLTVESHNAHLLHEPWTVATKTGTPYSVYSPFWRAVAERHVPQPLPVPKLSWPATWPASDQLSDWQLEADMRRGAGVVAPHLLLGEEAAQARLQSFLADELAAYPEARDRLDRPTACSGLSEPLAWGEIGPRQIWHQGIFAREAGNPGAEKFLKELVWRDFAYHLMFHHPDLATQNWRVKWDGFPWQGESEAALRWRRGETGVEGIDAAMRELYVTGRMHNRARMLVASYLTKHLLTDWRLGLAWFAETLTDWDPASNAMGWQWVAGCGPDAAPYFRIFNPDTQAQKFDPEGRYRRHWLLGQGAEQFGQARPLSWQSPLRAAPAPMISLADGRARALEVFQASKT